MTGLTPCLVLTLCLVLCPLHLGPSCRVSVPLSSGERGLIPMLVLDFWTTSILAQLWGKEPLGIAL